MRSIHLLTFVLGIGGGGGAPLAAQDIDVTPTSSSVNRTVGQSGLTDSFEIENNTGSSFSLTIECEPETTVVCTNVSPSSVVLAGLQDTLVTVTYSVPAAGTKAIHLGVSGDANGFAAMTVHVQDPYTAPLVDATIHNGTNADVSRCLLDCLHGTLGYSTPAYFRLDQPRSFTLLYRSEQARPMPVVIIDAQDTSSTTASRHSISLRRWDGSLQTVTGGYTEIHYNRHVSGTNRLAAQFDATGLATGAYAFDVIVRSYWDVAGSPMRERIVPVTLLVVNESASPFGWGWSAPGLQRANWTVNQGADNHGVSGVVITEGDGSAKLFTGACAFTTANCTFTAPAGEFSTLRYVGGDTTRIIRTYPDGTKVFFLQSGHPAYMQDRFGSRTSFTWSGDLLTAVRDSSWSTNPQSITLHYTGGHLDSIRTPDGRTSHVTINASGNVTEIRNPLGQRVLKSITYNSNHLLTSYRELSGAQWTLGYDFASRLRRITAPWVMVDGDPTDTIRPESNFVAGERTLLQNDTSGGSANARAGRATTAFRDQVTAPGGAVTQIRLDRWRQPTTITEDVNGALERVSAVLSYNSAGQMTRDSSHTGRVATLTWTGPVLTSSRVTQSGTGRDATTFEYDTARYYALRIVRVDTAVIVEQHLTALGLPDTTWAGGRPTSTTVDTVYAARTFNARGQVTSETTSDRPGDDPHTTTIWHSLVNGNTSAVVAPGGATTTLISDAIGRVQRVINALGDTVRFTFDALNRTLTTTDAAGEVSTNVYGDSLNLLTFTDPAGQAYRQQFDALGRPVWAEDPLGARVYFGYDVDSRLIRTTNRRGQNIRLWYDDLSRPTVRVAEAEEDTLTWTYTADGRSVTIANDEGTVTSIADPRGMSDTIAATIGGESYALVYNMHPRRFTLFEIEFHPPDGANILSTYLGHAGAGQLTSLDVPGAGTTYLNYENDLGSYEIRAPLSGEVFRITTVKATSSGAPGVISYLAPTHQAAFGEDIERDDLGRAVRVVDADRDSAWEYSYDANGRLTSAVRRAGSFDSCTWDEHTGSDCATWGTTTSTHSFTWDEVGNPTHRNAVITTGNRLRAIDIPAGRDSLVYDADGNVTQRYVNGTGFQVFTWNSLGQLTNVSIPIAGQSTSYGYGPTGERVRRTHNGTSTYYVWDRGNLAAELSSTGAVLRRYSHYGGLDSPHSLTIGDSTYFYIASPPGSVAGLLNDSAGIANRYEFTPFGEAALVQQQSNLRNTLRFAGAELDTITGLYYLRNRWYSPSWQRFISEDPIGLRGGINPYEYAHGNPIGLRDPMGLDPCAYAGQTSVEYGKNDSYKCDWGMVAFGGIVDTRLLAGGFERILQEAFGGDPVEIYRKEAGTNDETQYKWPAATVSPSWPQCMARAGAQVTLLFGVEGGLLYGGGTALSNIGDDMILRGLNLQHHGAGSTEVAHGYRIHSLGRWFRGAGRFMRGGGTFLGGLALGYGGGAALACASNSSYYD